MTKVSRARADRNLFDELIEAMKNFGKMLRPQELKPARIPERHKRQAHRRKKR